MTSQIDTPFQVVIASDDSQIAFDATVSERHQSKLTVTEHPVETGANVTDHAKKEPDVIDLQGIISDHPILLNVIEDRKPSVLGTSPKERAKSALREFQRLQDIAALLTVTTESRTYEDMMITSISVPKDSARRHILDISLTMRQFRRASVETVEAPEPVEPVHKAKRKQGRKQKKTPKKEVEQKSQGLLERIVNAVSGTG
jgi:hypothetical protein